MNILREFSTADDGDELVAFINEECNHRGKLVKVLVPDESANIEKAVLYNRNGESFLFLGTLSAWDEHILRMGSIS